MLFIVSYLKCKNDWIELCAVNSVCVNPRSFESSHVLDQDDRCGRGRGLQTMLNAKQLKKVKQYFSQNIGKLVLLPIAVFGSLRGGFSDLQPLEIIFIPPLVIFFFSSELKWLLDHFSKRKN